MCLEQLVVFMGAGRGDEMPVRVAVPGMARSFAGGGMAGYRPGRGVARGAPCCSDEERGEERGGEKTGESHERPLRGCRGIPMLPRGLRDLHGNSDFCGQNGKFSRCDNSGVLSRSPLFAWSEAPGSRHFLSGLGPRRFWWGDAEGLAVSARHCTRR